MKIHNKNAKCVRAPFCALPKPDNKYIFCSEEAAVEEQAQMATPCI